MTEPDLGGPAAGAAANASGALAGVPTTEWSGGSETAVRVSTVELFFDLVFVFIITQLTGVLADHTTLVSLVRVLLMLGVTWWMYGGYAWLTNAVVPSNTLRRGLLVVGMAGFLTMAMAVPDAFDTTGLGVRPRLLRRQPRAHRALPALRRPGGGCGRCGRSVRSTC